MDQKTPRGLGMQVRRATRSGKGGGHALGGVPPTLVTDSFVPWSRVQVSWITFGEKMTFPKVSFRLIFRFFETLK